MAVISKLNLGDKDITLYDNSIIRNINLNNVDYHFAERKEVPYTICKDAVAEPIVDMRIVGNSVQNGEPSTEAPVEIESVGEKSKNLLNYKDLFSGESFSAYGITYTKTDKGIFVNGTSTGFASTSLVIDLKPLLEVGKTYVASGGTSDVYVVFYSRTNGVANYSGIKTITGQEETISVYLQTNANVTVDNVLITPQLEEGNVATEYEPYGYKIPIQANGEDLFNIYIKEPLRKIKEYADYIDYKNKKVVRQVYKTNLNEHNWTSNNATNAIYYTNVITNAPAPVGTTATSYCLCNVLQENSISSASNYIGIQAYTSGIFRTRPDLTIYDTIEKWQEYINTHDCYVIYPIADTEEIIDIPEIATSNGKNVFSVETSIKPSSVSIEYWKQIKPQESVEDITQQGSTLYIVATGDEVTQSANNLIIGG